MHLRLRGQQPGQHPGQPERLTGRVRAEQVLARGGRGALGEDDVQHAQHAAEPLVPLVGRRQLERHLRGGQRLLRTGDPRLDRRPRHREGPRDLVRGQPSHHPQGQRDPRLGGEHRVAGDEHQGEHVVVDLVEVRQQGVEPVLHLRGARRRRLLPLAQPVRQRRVPPVQGRPAPEAVDPPPPPDGQQPPARVGRDTVPRPALQRLGQCLLRQVLGQRQVAGPPGERADDPRRLDPPDGLHRDPGRLVRVTRRPGDGRSGRRGVRVGRQS